MKIDNIDYGKIIALHNARWSSGKIADEMRMSNEEYYELLTGLLEKMDRKIKCLEYAYRKVSDMLKN